MNNMYLIKVGEVWFPYSSKVGDRNVSKETARSLWVTAYPEHAATIQVVDAPEFDANSNPFSIAWGMSYKKSDLGYEVHSNGR